MYIVKNAEKEDPEKLVEIFEKYNLPRNSIWKKK